MEPGGLEEIEPGVGTRQLECAVQSVKHFPEREFWIFRGWAESTHCILMSVCVGGEGGQSTFQLTVCTTLISEYSKNIHLMKCTPKFSKLNSLICTKEKMHHDRVGLSGNARTV